MLRPAAQGDRLGHGDSRHSAPGCDPALESTEGGLRAGGGLQLAVGPNAYVGAEYRISTYEAALTRHQGVAALGFRF